MAWTTSLPVVPRFMASERMTRRLVVSSSRVVAGATSGPVVAPVCPHSKRWPLTCTDGPCGDDRNPTPGLPGRLARRVETAHNSVERK